MAQNRIIHCLITDVEETEAKHLTVYDLLEMTEDDRQVVMEKAFALAANDTFEIFEAFDNEDFNDDD